MTFKFSQQPISRADVQPMEGTGGTIHEPMIVVLATLFWRNKILSLSGVVSRSLPTAHQIGIAMVIIISKNLTVPKRHLMFGIR